ncbi:MAG: choline-sulfatase, partial [Deltaproteobacteria bacterium]
MPQRYRLTPHGALLWATLALCFSLPSCTPSQPPPIAPPRALPRPLGAGLATTSPATDGPVGSARPSVSGTTAEPKPPPKLNVVVIFIDAMRADMPWAGYPRDIAPNLTALEKRSVSYTRAYALSSYTAMSDAGFLAGRYPGELKRSGYFFSAYPEDELFFPELLQPAGVRTLAAHAHFYFEKKAGFHQGFDDYRVVANLDADNTTDKNITSPRHVALAKTMLSDEANTGGQFFAWFHFLDPHDRYMTHEGFTRWGTGQRDRYDGEIAFTDHHVGKLLAFIDAQPWGKHTAIVV